MSLVDLARFAWRALLGHPLRSALSLLGMAVGVAAVIVLTALGEGARGYVAGEFASIGSNLLIVLPGKTETTGGFPGIGRPPHDLTLDDYEAVVRGLRQVERGAPISTATGTVSHRERRRQMAIFGTTSDFLEVRKLHMGYGRFLPPLEIGRGASVVVLGDKAARELFPGENPLGQIVRVDEWRMRVIGVLAPKGTQMGLDVDDIALVPVATAMRLFNRPSLFRMIFEVRSYADLDHTAADVVRILKERHDEEDVTVLTQDSVVSTLGEILGTLTLVLTAIASISLSVAGIGIMNVMLVSVSERTSEVGLLKALGVARRQIVAAFLTEAVLLSIAGSLVGLGAGWLAVLVVVDLYPAFPASPPLWAVGSAILVALVVGILFGVLPARRAAGLNPIAALSRR